MNDAQIERIHVLWDELADFDTADAERFLDHLLAALCSFANAQNACWFGAVRLSDIGPTDPLRGWRPRGVYYLRPSLLLDRVTKGHVDNIEQGEVDVTMVRNVAMAGRFRANRLVDLAPEGWFESEFFRRTVLAIGRIDAIYAGVPINDDAECYFGVFRDTGQPRFSEADRDLVAYILRGLKWLCRRQMLSRGLMIASAPLTSAEREVLGGLLTGLSEKQIAAAREQSPHTTHEHVTNIYRKFGVKNRAALMALWLGNSPP